VADDLVVQGIIYSTQDVLSPVSALETHTAGVPRAAGLDVAAASFEAEARLMALPS